MQTNTKNEAAAGQKNHGTIIIKNLCYKGRIKRTEGDEYVEIMNSGTAPEDVTGYKLTAGSHRQEFVFPAHTVLAPGKSVRVYTNHHDAATGGLSFHSKTAIWNNKGDECKLVDATGTVVAEYAYGSRKAKKSGDGDGAANSDKNADGGTSAAGSLAATEVWTRVKAMWPGFEFMWQPGDSEEDLAATEGRLAIKLPPDVRQLMTVCSGAGAGFPAGNLGFAAEVCLRPVKYWESLVTDADFQSVKEQMDGVEQEYFPKFGLKDVMVIGENPAGADYGMYVLLETSTGKVSKLKLDELVPEPIGSFQEWLLGTRPYKGLAIQSSAYVGTSNYEESLSVDDPDASAEAFAANHRDHLQYSHDKEYLLKTWDAVQSRFIAAVNRLNKK